MFKTDMEEAKSLFFSFLRVFGAAAGAVYLTIGKAPLDLGMSDLRSLVNAGLAAAVLTVINWLRTGDNRFGRKNAVDTPPAG